jgi:hypothetical protein
LSPLEESLEFLDLEEYEQHRCVHHTHEALDLSSFTKLRLLGIAPELLMGDKRYSCDLKQQQLRDEGIVEFVDKLTRSVEKIRFLDAPCRSRKLSFWALLVRNLVHSRKLKLLSNLRKIAIEPVERGRRRCRLCTSSIFFANDECRESPDLADMASMCAAAGIVGRWWRRRDWV